MRSVIGSGYTSMNGLRRWVWFKLVIVFSMEIMESSLSCSDQKLTSPTCNNEKPNDIRVLAVVPTMYPGINDFTLVPTWMKGEEILPAAKLAHSEISKLGNILGGHRLEIIPVIVPMCDLNEGILQFVASMDDVKNTVVGTVGYFCHNLVQHLSQLQLRHNQIRTIQISARSLPTIESEHQYSILSYSQSTAIAAVKMLQRLKWNRIGVICNQNINYINQRKEFVKVANEHGTDVALDMDTTFGSPQILLQEIQNVGIKIIVSFVSPSEAVDILCSAYLGGYKWPDYAWILMEMNDISELLNIQKVCSQDRSLTIDLAMNNTIFLRPTLTTPSIKNILSSGENYNSYHNAYIKELEEAARELNVPLQSNPYANVIYDSVWALALTLNRSLSILNERNLSLANISQARGEIFDVMDEQLSELSFHGATGFLNFSHDRAAVQLPVHILQYQNNQQMVIGSYNLALDRLILNITSLGDIPSDTLERVFILYPTWLMAILLVLIIACFILTTVSMFLFIYFRKKPAIKATSNTLSLCMFVGCYLLLSSSLFETINSSTIRKESLRAFNCMLDIYLIAIGLDTVLATVIAKTIRIYHIFHKFGKVSRIFSDPGLFVFILMIVFGRIILLVIWTCLDISSVVDVEEFVSQSVPPYYQVSEQCYARHLGIWLGLHFGYSAILMLIMVLLAILTRNIKRQYFKDSKKINTLVMTLVFDLLIFVPMWLILRLIGAIIPSRLAYCFSTLIASLLCLVFLVWPKLLPLILQSCKRFNTSSTGIYSMPAFRSGRHRQSQLISKN